MNADGSDVRVKVADYAVRRGEHVIATIGLGSCVAIVLYDRDTRTGGLAHILLPSQAMSRETANPAKFPETIVPLMLQEMRALAGGASGRLSAKIVGGASMFGNLIPSGGINVGERNIAAVRGVLSQAKIPIIAEDVGSDHGRSVFLFLEDGRVEVRSLKKGSSVL